MIAAAVLALLGSSTLGRAAVKPAPKSSARLDAVYGAISDRMSTQQNLWFKGGNYLTVVQSLRIQYALNPSDYEIATNLAWMCENINQRTEAERIYIEFHRNNMSNPDSAEPLGLFYYRNRMISKIPPVLEPTIHAKVKPGPNTYRLLAHAYDRLHKYSDAIRVYKAYLKLYPKDAAAIRNLDRVEKEKAKGAGSSPSGSSSAGSSPASSSPAGSSPARSRKSGQKPKLGPKSGSAH